MIRFVVLALLLSTSALAEDAGMRRFLLGQQLEALKIQEVRAARAHDAWINAASQPAPPPGLPKSSLFTAREDWIKVLAAIRDISVKLYPDAPVDFAGKPDAGLPEAERRAHRGQTMPKIQTLHDKIEAEIAAAAKK